MDSYCHHFDAYNSAANRSLALSAASSHGLTTPSPDVRMLLRWFKEDFFRWVDGLPCASCGQKQKCVGRTAASADERRFGAMVTELHECERCACSARFPRFNDPAKLLETRQGRCGEWANCFALMCCAFGFETRFVLDKTDHVWCEVWSEDLGRWTHLDPCENAFDSPMMYEQGWGKKLSYVIAFGEDHVVDVTAKYTKDFAKNVLPQRNDPRMDAELARLHVQQRRKAIRNGWCTDPRLSNQRLLMEQVSFLTSSRDVLKEEEMRGRISGSAEWRRARGEDGAR